MNHHSKKIISTPLAPTPIGPYSQAVVVDNHMVYVSGQVGKNVRTGQMVTESVRAEVHQAFANMKIVLEASGATMANVVKVTIFITNFNDFPVVNEVMKEFFTAPFPARSTVAVSELPLKAKIEIESVAHLDHKESNV